MQELQDTCQTGQYPMHVQLAIKIIISIFCTDYVSIFSLTILKVLYHIHQPVSMEKVPVPFLYQVLIAKEMNQTFSVVLTV